MVSPPGHKAWRRFVHSVNIYGQNLHTSPVKLLKIRIICHKISKTSIAFQPTDFTE